MILLRSSLRQIVHHPLQLFMALVGVALGVGVVTSVDLANESSLRAFRLAAETIAGKATHQVTGQPAGLPERLYVHLKLGSIDLPLAPVVEDSVKVLSQPGGTLRLVGVDPFAESPFRSYGDRFLRASDLESLVARPGTGMLLRSTAARYGLSLGGTLVIEAGGQRKIVSLCGYLQPTDEIAREGLQSVLVTDIATAQEVLGMLGRLSRIDMIVSPGAAGDTIREEVQRLLPPGVSLLAVGARTGTLENMTRAFRLNLTALSLLALVVGMFLIYNTVTFSIVRRRRMIGLLRSIGVSRRRLFAILLGEVCVIGLVGTAAGLLFGTILSREMIRLVTRTINDLYFAIDVSSVELVPGAYLKAGCLGLIATVLAALPPLIEATSVPPRAALSRETIEGSATRLVPRVTVAGVVAMCLGCSLLVAEASGVTGGFAGLFLIILGYSLVVPSCLVLFSTMARRLMSGAFGAVGRLAAGGVAASLSRTAVATAALVVAVSATIGIGVMVDSFRGTVALWLTNWLRADVYVTTAGTGSGRNKPAMDARIVERLAKAQGVSAISMTRRVTIQDDNLPTELLAMDTPASTFTSYEFREGNPVDAWAPFERGDAVIVSEPYAYHHRIHRGNVISLHTSRGERSFVVAGVFSDYGSDSGVVIVNRSAYVQWWGDSTIDGMGFYARPGTEVATLADQLRTLGAGSSLTVITNRGLRDESLAVFDRTFAITGVLRFLIVVVAFVGIFSALMSMQLERGREFAVLRAIGLTPGQMWGLVGAETGLLGLISGVLSLPLGLFQALILVHVINRRSFGWTIHLSVAPAILMEALILSVVAAVVAGAYPAWRIAATPPAVALKEEE